MPVEDKNIRLLEHAYANCTKCAIGRHAYRHVFYDQVPTMADKPDARLDVLFVGEGPGNSENIIGSPFIGPSGKLLRGAIREAGFDGLVVGFANMVACRPCEDAVTMQVRPPTDDEIANCAVVISNIVAIKRPWMVVTVGRVAEDQLHRVLSERITPGCQSAPLSKSVDYQSIPHPAYILRDGGTASQMHPAYCASLADISHQLKTIRSI